MLVYQSKYSSTSYDKIASIVHSSWASPSDKLTDEEFKVEMRAILEQIKKYMPAHIIINTKEFRFPVTQHTQDWIVKNFIVEVMVLGVRKYAIIVNEDAMPAVKMEGIHDEPGEDFDIEYFINEEDARNWLN
jgi:hypothetical protein